MRRPSGTSAMPLRATSSGAPAEERRAAEADVAAGDRRERP